MRTIVVASCVVVAIAISLSAAPAAAQGKAKVSGLSKALANAGGKGASSSALGRSSTLGRSAGLGRASQSLGRTGSSLGRATALNHAGLNNAGGLGRGPIAPPAAGRPDFAARPAVAPPVEGSRQQHLLSIELRNRDHRLATAEHLRQIAQRNGDAELAANADRMAASAQEHYLRRAQHLERFGTIDPDPLLEQSGPTLAAP
jgi:hypothetical protein